MSNLLYKMGQEFLDNCNPIMLQFGGPINKITNTILSMGGTLLTITRTNFWTNLITLHTKDANTSSHASAADIIPLKNGNKNPSDIALMLEIFIKLNVPIPCRLRGNDRNNVLFMQSYEVSTSSLQYRDRRIFRNTLWESLNLWASHGHFSTWLAQGYILNSPKFTANLYCTCLSIPQI